MANDNWYEMHSSETVGSYSTNSFFIKAHSLADLDPDYGEPLQGAIHVHAHEYVHYLHNISTVAGLYLCTATLWLMSILAICTDASGQYPGDDALTDEQRQTLSSVVAWLVALNGSVKWENGNEDPIRVPVKWSFEAPIRKAIQISLPGQTVSLEIGSVAGTVSDAQGSVFPLTIDIGYHLITEGVAYEVDREIRRENGAAEQELDERTPPYPYLAYGALIDHLLGRQATPRERIYVGVVALQSSSPGVTVVEFCESLKALAPTSSDDKLQTPIELGDAFQTIVEQTLKPVLVALHGDRPGQWGGFDVLALFKEGIGLRSRDGVLEFAFIGAPMDKVTFRSRIAAMVDCCVIQAKPDNKVIHEWVGPGLVAQTEAEASRIGVFQASLHYVGLHVRPSGGFHSTSALRPTACPYSGGCQVEIDDGMPNECKSRPWTRYKDVPLGGKTCWYAAGVKAFVKQTQPPLGPVKAAEAK